MPSSSKKQAKLMQAISHGWEPSKMKNPPSRTVAREFVAADKKKKKKYHGGGLAQAGVGMNRPRMQVGRPTSMPPGRNVDPREGQNMAAKPSVGGGFAAGKITPPSGGKPMGRPPGAPQPNSPWKKGPPGRMQSKPVGGSISMEAARRPTAKPPVTGLSPITDTGAGESISMEAARRPTQGRKIPGRNGEPRLKSPSTSGAPTARRVGAYQSPRQPGRQPVPVASRGVSSGRSPASRQPRVTQSRGQSMDKSSVVQKSPNSSGALQRAMQSLGRRKGIGRSRRSQRGAL